MSRTAIEVVPSQHHLSFSNRGIDEVFPGFILGDFAALHGSSAILSLSMSLCVRAQLPIPLGGLGTNVILVDGGNTFRLYEVSRLAQHYMLNPKKTLERIFISRAFTVYQMTSLVLERLKDVINKYDSKIVMISDISRLYLDEDVPKAEARVVFNQLARYLSSFAEKEHIIVIATFFPHLESRRNTFFKSVLCGRANVVVSVKPCKAGHYIALEKHPALQLQKSFFPSVESPTLTSFMEV